MKPSILIRRLQSLYASEDHELLTILMNSPSPAEVNLAVQSLREGMDTPALVAALNLRDLLDALPHCPASLGVDYEMLVRAAGLRATLHGHEKRVGGHGSILVVGDGKFLLDMQLRGNSTAAGPTPPPGSDSIVDEDFLDLVFESPELLDAMVGLLRDGGLVIDPTFYVSLTDWQLEHAQGAMSELASLF